MELNALKEEFKVESTALGSINLFNLFKRKQRRKGRKHTNKILYCPALPQFYAYKDVMMVHMDDKDYFDVSRSVVEVINELDLQMDIKIHPADEKHGFLYFTKLLRTRASKKVRILKGFRVEWIIRNFGLMILDHFGTMLIPLSIVLYMPVILYVKDWPRLDDEVVKYMKKRFYLVKNKDELKRCLGLYSAGKLDSKFSLEIVDKYAFPIESGNPGPHISNYIRDLVLN